MPAFLSEDGSKVVLTSRNVMHSTIKSQENYHSISDNSIAKINIKRYIFGKQSIDYLIIVRNTYKRIELFFRDKFRLGVFYKNKWQDCQTIFFDHLGIKGVQDDVIKKRLRNTKFDQFVDILPKVYQKDSHLRPQYERLYLYVNFIGLSWKMKINDIHIEKM